MHLSTQCLIKGYNQSPKCANCGQGHVANFSECLVRLEALKIRFGNQIGEKNNTAQMNSGNNVTNQSKKNVIRNISQRNIVKSNVSFANATAAGTGASNNNTVVDMLNQIMEKLKILNLN